MKVPISTKQQVSSWESVLCNSNEYLKRTVKALKCAAWLISFVAVISLAVTFISFAFTSVSSVWAAFYGSIASSAGIAYPIRIEQDGMKANYGELRYGDAVNGDTGDYANERGSDDAPFDIGIFWICLVGVGLSSTVVLIFTGRFSAIFLDPINPIKISPVALLDSRTACLSTQVWVCYPDDVYMQDISFGLNYSSDCSFDDASIMMCGKGAGSSTKISHARVTALRGVWEILIPLESEECRGIRKKMGENPNDRPGFQIIVQGKTSGGNTVTRIQRYRPSQILDSGFCFALFRCPGAVVRRHRSGGRGKCPLWRGRYRGEMKPHFGSFITVVALNSLIQLGERRAKVKNVYMPDKCDDMSLYARSASKGYVARELNDWKDLLVDLHKTDPVDDSLFMRAEPSFVWDPHITLSELVRINKA